MKKGLLSGWGKRSRKTRLVYFSLGGGMVVATSAAADPQTASADVNVTLTRPLNGLPVESTLSTPMLRPQFPAQGVVGVAATLIARNTASVSQFSFYVMNYEDDTNPVGLAAASLTWRGSSLYAGKVVNHYESAFVPFIKTGGIGNTQFKYAADWAAGTMALYLHVVGYWMEVPI